MTPVVNNNEKEVTRNFLIEWNYLFPLDRWWREKHGVAFLSKKHKKITQLQITYEYLEEQMFDEFVKESNRRKEIEQNYKKGIWVIDRSSDITETDEEELFKNLNISEFNDQPVD